MKTNKANQKSAKNDYNNTKEYMAIKYAIGSSLARMVAGRIILMENNGNRKLEEDAVY